MEWDTLEKNFKNDSKKVFDWLIHEFSSMRSGRINVGIFDKILVNSYGQNLKLNQVSNIQIVNATQVIIKPYDSNNIQEIIKAINKANIGITPVAINDYVKINFPPQTEENRKEHVKKAKQLLEQAKNRIREIRKNVQSSYKNLNDVSKDKIYYFEECLNKLTKQQNNELENIYQKKEKDLLTL